MLHFVESKCVHSTNLRRSFFLELRVLQRLKGTSTNFLNRFVNPTDPLAQTKAIALVVLRRMQEVMQPKEHTQTDSQPNSQQMTHGGGRSRDEQGKTRTGRMNSLKPKYCSHE